jgi:uncharacterized protein YjbJ (UPF0337 family)
LYPDVKEDTMLRVRDVGQAVQGFGEKVIGLNFEFVGTIVGNDRLRDRGRSFSEAGDERLRSVEREAKAAARQAEAKGHEAKQRAHQGNGRRTSSRSTGGEPSAPRAVAETAKGAVKEVAGKVSGSDRLEDEGREQRERGKDEGAAAKHEAKAGAHREKAEIHRDIAERR